MGNGLEINHSSEGQQKNVLSELLKKAHGVSIASNIQRNTISTGDNVVDLKMLNISGQKQPHGLTVV